MTSLAVSETTSIDMVRINSLPLALCFRPEKEFHVVGLGSTDNVLGARTNDSATIPTWDVRLQALDIQHEKFPALYLTKTEPEYLPEGHSPLGVTLCDVESAIKTVLKLRFLNRQWHDDLSTFGIHPVVHVIRAACSAHAMGLLPIHGYSRVCVCVA